MVMQGKVGKPAGNHKPARPKFPDLHAATLALRCALVRVAGLGHPRNAARITRIEALLSDPQCGVHPRPHVFSPYLISQLDYAVLAEAGPQVGYLLVGDAVRIGGHRVGIGDRGPLIIGETW